MTAPLRMGLIGAGRIGQVHANSITAVPDTTLQRICDPVIENARAVARQHGGEVTADPAEMVAADDLDAVIIASSTPTHADLMEAALDAGLPALCEKPIDLDIGRIDRLRAKAAAASVPIMVGFNRRFDPHFADLQRRVADDEIGALEQLTIVSRDPGVAPRDILAASGGIFRDMTIHDFDTARFFVPDIVEVIARGVNQFSADIMELDDYDAVLLVLTGVDGQQISITNSRRAVFGYDQRIEAFGAKGLLQIGNITDSSVRLWSQAAVESLAPYQNFFQQRYADAYRLELCEFVRAVRGEPNRCAGFEDGRAALVLADAAEKSARSGCALPVDLT